MYPTSTEFTSTVRKSHTAVARAEVWYADQLLRTLSISTGEVRVDAKSAIRRTCSVTMLADRISNDLVPADAYSDLAPFGNELKLYRGVVLPSTGAEEYVPLGVFVITSVEISDRVDGVEIKVNGVDRSFWVASNPWTQPYQVASGGLSAVLTELLSNRYPGITVSFPTVTTVVNQMVLGTDMDNDPWKDAVQIAEEAGYDLYFDQDGSCVLAAFPTLEGSSVVATYSEDSNAVVLDMSRQMTVEGTYNGIVFVVETSQTNPIRVEVYDEDPDSPTYRYGKFGQRTKMVSSTTVKTVEDARAAATALLNRYLGSQEQVSWTQIVNPAHDANDLIFISNTGTKINRTVILDNLTIPLDPVGTLTAQARTVRVIGSSQVIES